MRRDWLVWALFFFFIPEVIARDLYVGGDGVDRYPSLQSAIDAARPGDTIHLDPQHGPYRQKAVFDHRQGAAEQPITLDGHGATLLGTDPLDPGQWEDRGDGLWRSDRLRYNRPRRGRFFFVIDGRPQFMGGASKHQAPILKAPDTLQPGEWTWVEEEQAFYLRIAARRSLAEAGIEVPMRSAGVLLRGHSAHLVIRNIRVRHVWNDGFNIHGQSEDVLFENIEAIECGDDGISAHGQCAIVVRGFISRGNANGMCHVDESRSVNERVHILESRAHDLYLLNASRHELRNVVIDAAAPRGVVFNSGTQVHLDQVIFRSAAGAFPFRVRREADLRVERSAFWNAQIHVEDASADWHHSWIAGGQASLTVHRPRHWQEGATIWELATWGGDARSLVARDPQEATRRGAPTSWKTLHTWFEQTGMP